MTEAGARAAADVGGTFTDVVWLDERTGRHREVKVLTTPDAFQNGVLSGLRIAAGDGERGLSTLIHGTTVVINALIERSGPTTALVTTRGFRDVLEIGRGNRPDLFNLRPHAPAPFVERSLRFEVDERLDHRGREVRPLSRADVEAVVEDMHSRGVAAVAICFLHSYVNPTHELECAAILSELAPEIDVTCSTEVSRQWREYERTSTAVLNAYVRGTTSNYLTRLEDGLETAHPGTRLMLMQSNGGVISPESARTTPIHLIESGPVAGVIGAAAVAERIGVSDLITLDIGGTTAKASLVRNSEVAITSDYRLEPNSASHGYPITAPVVDIVEIGAGGGSVAWIDEYQRIGVGPRSAGAVPGPACYGRGGTEPTVTDANLILGRLGERSMLGGEMLLDSGAAIDALADICDATRVSPIQAALGIIRLANMRMISTLRMVSLQRGHDPREFMLVGYGGGAGLHVAELAAELRIPRVLIPPKPGVFSSSGMLAAPMRRDWIQTYIALVGSDDAALDQAWQNLHKAAVAAFQAEGEDSESLEFSRYLDTRYLGQEHTVRLHLNNTGASIVQLHESQHLSLYGFRLDAPVEIVNLHLSAAMPEAAFESEVLAQSNRTRDQRRDVWFDGSGAIPTPMVHREELAPGRTIHGPAIVEEATATTVVPAGARVTRDQHDNLILNLEPR